MNQCSSVTETIPNIEERFRLLKRRVRKANDLNAKCVGYGFYQVPSSTNPTRKYLVDLENPKGPTCDCKDYQYRAPRFVNHKCKHIIAAMNERDIQDSIARRNREKPEDHTENV